MLKWNCAVNSRGTITVIIVVQRSGWGVYWFVESHTVDPICIDKWTLFALIFDKEVDMVLSTHCWWRHQDSWLAERLRVDWCADLACWRASSVEVPNITCVIHIWADPSPRQSWERCPGSEDLPPLDRRGACVPSLCNWGDGLCYKRQSLQRMSCFCPYILPRG